MSASGLQTFARSKQKSALPPNSDMARYGTHVSNGPRGGVGRFIQSLGRQSPVSGTSNPRARAVFLGHAAGHKAADPYAFMESVILTVDEPGVLEALA
jgi:hypothetical protein